MKIFLIGMPGSGKTTLGRALARHLGADFIDLDKEIENYQGLSVSEIFNQKGEDEFRRVESELLTKWASSSSSFVMATGGGAPCFYRGIDIINAAGLSIFLDVSVNEILNRVASHTHRPLLGTDDAEARRDRLKSLYESRIATYRKASIVLDNPTLASVLNALPVKM